MKSRLLKALPMAAFVILAGCEHNGFSVSELERTYYAGCATEPPTDPACGRH